MLSSYSPSANFRIPVSPAGELYMCLLPWFLCLVPLGTRRDCIPGSQGTVAIREMVLDRLLFPGHFRESSRRHITKSFCEGGLFACPGVSALGAGFRSGKHLQTNRATLKKPSLWMPS